MTENLLSWDVEKELGFYPIQDTQYDDFYYRASVENSLSPVAEKLNEFRTWLVNSYVDGTILDFGVGAGQFLHWRGDCLGYDICPKSVANLRREGLFFDPYKEDLDERAVEGVTFFDVLEHLLNPETILARVREQYVFISLPIFRDREHALKSKHFKIHEHYWYFTQKSIREFMASCGFELVEYYDGEIKAGREDIYTYVFLRPRFCKSCFWRNVPRLPVNKKKYGAYSMCLEPNSTKRKVKETDKACRFYLSENKRWDDNLMKFVPISKWTQRK